jgi:hypothetical protein
MRFCKGALSLCLLLSLAACLGETPERARIIEVRLLRDSGRDVLEITQRLEFSPTMRDALEHGIALRLTYRIDACDYLQAQVIRLSYSPLHRRYELQREGDASPRRFVRRSAMLAALDRIRLPLATAAPLACKGNVAVALDLTSLPTPLRFPALLHPDQWRLVSPSTPWNAG